MEPEPKRRKIHQRQQHGTISSLVVNKGKDTMPMCSLKASVIQQDFRVQQARNFAVTQAQQNGSKGNFKIFDSPFGNFLVPAVLNRAELSG